MENPPKPSRESSIRDIERRELRRMFEADQDDRRGWPLDMAAIGARDQDRQARTRRWLSEFPLRSAEECYWAAVIFVHSQEAPDLATALDLAIEATGREPEKKVYRRMAAIALDRWLVANRQKQWFGTVKEVVDGLVELSPIDEDMVCDDLRRKCSIKPLGRIRRELKQQNDRARRARQELERRRSATLTDRRRPERTLSE